MQISWRVLFCVNLREGSEVPVRDDEKLGALPQLDAENLCWALQGAHASRIENSFSRNIIS